jgi:hypothetical protein
MIAPFYGDIITADIELPDPPGDIPPDLKWEVEQVDGYVRFKHAGSGARLDSKDERSVYLHQPNEGSYQKWVVGFEEDGRNCTVVNLATGFALDCDAEGHAYTLEPNDGAYQRWVWISA